MHKYSSSGRLENLQRSSICLPFQTQSKLPFSTSEPSIRLVCFSSSCLLALALIQPSSKWPDMWCVLHDDDYLVARTRKYEYYTHAHVWAGALWSACKNANLFNLRHTLLYIHIIYGRIRSCTFLTLIGEFLVPTLRAHLSFSAPPPLLSSRLFCYHLPFPA